jgi:hypothetical protein
MTTKFGDKMKLNSIEAEAAACRKAFKGFSVGGLTLHCHHQILIEMLDEPAKNRITYILIQKAKDESPEQIALRLRLFRPIRKKNLRGKEELATYNKIVKLGAKIAKLWAAPHKLWAERVKLWAERVKLRAERAKRMADLALRVHPYLCKGCTWDGRTIFPKKAK